MKDPAPQGFSLTTAKRSNDDLGGSWGLPGLQNGAWKGVLGLLLAPCPETPPHEAWRLRRGPFHGAGIEGDLAAGPILAR